jgi:hypothetical protein
MGSAPKPPPPSAEEKAMVRRQRIRLDQEIAENERRLKAMAQSKFGKKSLLRTVKQAAAAEMPKKDLGPDITPGFIKTPSGAIKKKSRGRRRR